MNLIPAGIAKAGKLLGKKYSLQITNVPYAKKGKLTPLIAKYLETNFPNSKEALETVFLEKMLNANIEGGVSCTVIPQNGLFLTSYKKLRERLLTKELWSLVARLGAKSFKTPMWDFNVMLISLCHRKNAFENFFVGLDVSDASDSSAKDEALKTAEIKMMNQKKQLENPDARVIIGQPNIAEQLSTIAISPNGLHGGDSQRFRFFIWEVHEIKSNWKKLQVTVNKTMAYGGRSNVFYWPANGKIHYENPSARIQGESVWTRQGVAVSLMGNLPTTIFSGDAFDISCSPIVPKNQQDLAAIWCFCSSPQFNKEVGSSVYLVD
ncbi:MAG: hypothetical protein WKF91_08265 [Segetibacter sp.]